tara:strand:+ start:3113 stop:3718 length:606 start_codon:yes stop_codon:yes gene_type:complete
VRLHDLCEIQAGYTARARLEPATTAGVPAIQLRDISAAGRIEPDKLMRVDLGALPGRYFARAGDVLFRSRGDRNTASALDRRFVEPALALQPLLILRPKPDVVTSEYLAWAINQAEAQRHFDSGARGTKIRMVPKSCLDELNIDVPDVETQRKIIAVDDLVERENGLALLLAEKRKKLSRLILDEQAKLICRSAEPERKMK